MRARCWRCGSTVDLWPGLCQQACRGCGVSYEERDGIFDLLPAGSRPTARDPFEGAYGEFYDNAMSDRRWLANLGSLAWATDMNAMFDSMQAGAGTDPGETVLDVPVGGGTTLTLGARVRGLLVGIDRSLAMLRRAARRRRAARLDSKALLLRGDACALPLANSSVDKALCFNGLHVIPDWPAALREISRVLKPGGPLVGATLVKDTPPPAAWSLMAVTLAGLARPPSSVDVIEQARSAGFKTWEQERSGAVLHFQGTAG